jgi:D-threo-aldose 1-dehydrogenase
MVSTVVGISDPELLTQTVDLAHVPLPHELWEGLATVPPAMDDPERERFR